MANSLVTNQMIAKEAVRLYRNKNAFLMNLNRQYDEFFARTGAKAGQNIRIRLPVDYVLRTGPTAIVQNTIEQVVNLTVANQFGVDMSFSTVDRTMSIDRFADRYIKPAINTTVGGQAISVMSQAEGGVSGLVCEPRPDDGRDPVPGRQDLAERQGRDGEQLRPVRRLQDRHGAEHPGEHRGRAEGPVQQPADHRAPV